MSQPKKPNEDAKRKAVEKTAEQISRNSGMSSEQARRMVADIARKRERKGQ